MNITLKGEPKSTQHIYKSTCRGRFATVYMSKEGKDLKESYQWQAKSQYKGKPLEGFLSVSAHLYFGTKRKQDIDNFNKLFFDALSGIVWVDDAQIFDLYLTKDYDKENPRIEVMIQEI